MADVCFRFAAWSDDQQTLFCHRKTSCFVSFFLGKSVTLKSFLDEDGQMEPAYGLLSIFFAARFCEKGVLYRSVTCVILSSHDVSI